MLYLLGSVGYCCLVSDKTVSCFAFRYFVACILITKTRLFKYTENFTTKKWKFSDKNSDIFHISAQNIDCWYSLEPPHRGGSNACPQSMIMSRNKKNNVYPCKPQCYYIKVGFIGVNITWHVFVMCPSRYVYSFFVPCSVAMVLSDIFILLFWFI